MSSSLWATNHLAPGTRHTRSSLFSRHISAPDRWKPNVLVIYCPLLSEVVWWEPSEGQLQSFYSLIFSAVVPNSDPQGTPSISAEAWLLRWIRCGVSKTCGDQSWEPGNKILTLNHTRRTQWSGNVWSNEREWWTADNGQTNKSDKTKTWRLSGKINKSKGDRWGEQGADWRKQRIRPDETNVRKTTRTSDSAQDGKTKRPTGLNIDWTGAPVLKQKIFVTSLSHSQFLHKHSASALCLSKTFCLPFNCSHTHADSLCFSVSLSAPFWGRAENRVTKGACDNHQFTPTIVVLTEHKGGSSWEVSYPREDTSRRICVHDSIKNKYCRWLSQRVNQTSNIWTRNALGEHRPHFHPVLSSPHYFIYCNKSIDHQNIALSLSEIYIFLSHW